MSWRRFGRLATRRHLGRLGLFLGTGAASVRRGCARTQNRQTRAGVRMRLLMNCTARIDAERLAIVGNGLGEVATLLVHHAPAAESGRMRWVEQHGSIEVGGGLVEQTHVVVHDAATVECLDELRIERQRIVERRLGARQFALAQKRYATSVVRQQVLGLERQHAVVVRHRPVGFALSFVGCAPVERRPNHELAFRRRRLQDARAGGNGFVEVVDRVTVLLITGDGGM